MSECKVSQEELDWLVEGEMTPSERDDFLKRLDRDPDGWRRCAMAFMETSALRKSVQRICVEPAAAEQTFTGTQKKDWNRPAGRKGPARFNLLKSARANMALNSAAASVLVAVAFWVGASWGGFEGSLVSESTSKTAPTPDRDQARNSELWRDASRVVSSLDVPDGKVIALVSLPGHSETRVLPVIQSDTLEQQFFATARAAVPPSLAQELLKNGWRVNCFRQLLALKHPDGKHEIMPIDLMNYRFVGRPQL